MRGLGLIALAGVAALYVIGVRCRKASLVPTSGDQFLGHIKVGLDRLTGANNAGGCPQTSPPASGGDEPS